MNTLSSSLALPTVAERRATTYEENEMDKDSRETGKKKG